jgi:bacterioferritin (cytochrome b1)
VIPPAQDDEPRSRRGLLIAGAGVATGLLAGCSGSKPLREKVRGGAKVQPGDVIVLNQLLDLEQHTIAAYTAGLPLLRRSATKIAKQFLKQELAHAQSLTDLIHKAGGKPDLPPASYDLGHPASEDEVLELLRELESAQLSAYAQQIPGLSSGPLRAAVSAIYANDAQHLSVLRGELKLNPIPSPLAVGG